MTTPKNETLTPASRRDIPELSRFIGEYSHLFGLIPRNFFDMTLDADFPTPLDMGNHRIWIIKNIFTGQIYAVAYVFMAHDGWTNGKWLAVDPVHRRKGMGTTLFRLMVKQAREHGHALRFTCPQGSIANKLYQRHGARITYVERLPSGHALNHYELHFKRQKAA